jgi:fatty-acyl-CoA synthase
MRGLHPLDRRIGTEWPVLGSDADVRAFEATPFAERIAVTNTYDALRIGAARDPDAAALLFLPNADPNETRAASATASSSAG